MALCGTWIFKGKHSSKAISALAAGAVSAPPFAAGAVSALSSL